MCLSSQYFKERVSPNEVVKVYYSSLYPQGLSQSLAHRPSSTDV